MLAAWSGHKFVFRAINVIANDDVSKYTQASSAVLDGISAARMLGGRQQLLHQDVATTEECDAFSPSFGHRISHTLQNLN